MPISTELISSQINQINNAILLILPEVVLLGTVCVMFLVGPFFVGENGRAPEGLRNRWGSFSLLALACALHLWFWSDPPTPAGLGPFRVDQLTWYIRGLTMILGTVLTLVLWNQVEDSLSAECHACLLAIIAGVNLTAAANDLVGLFLGLELVSIPTYLFLYLPRRDAASREATIKYFLLSIFSSALVMYGFALLFGAAGTTQLTAVQEMLRNVGGFSGSSKAMVLTAVALIVAGLGFRVTAVPFHFYAPDVFQGVQPAGAAMLAFIPKVVGLVALMRIVGLTDGEVATQSITHLGAPLLAGLAVLTMFVGNLLALRQTNLHRLMAYSSVAHAGYMLAGLAIGGEAGNMVAGWSAVLFYLATYGVMTIGVFAVLSAFRRNNRTLQTVEDLAGLSRLHPGAALLMSVFLFSLTGLPPTAGFLAKMNLFLAAWSQGTSFGHNLAIIMAINAGIAAWYYLRLVTAMYLQPGIHTAPQRPQTACWIATLLCAAATIGLFLKPDPVWRLLNLVTG